MKEWKMYEDKLKIWMDIIVRSTAERSSKKKPLYTSVKNI